ncbi:MAG: PIN domain-containing protein [Candidatus Thermoplasmatota archaeon]|jgi:predicted nucleic acid-binding protein|nr:PIN domain-containing protein [Candidatus Thermoplasmatota archaeon]MDP7266495.1 PIN domain-containing protein [Candidatus Thermoplasmatota archaeon]
MGRIKYPPIFIDTSAWVALNEKKDIHHKKARSFIEKNKNGELNFGPIHTSELVLQETYTFLLYNYNYRAAMDIMGRILQSNVIIHPFNSLNFLNIWENIEERKTKLSFVDWSIVTYMKKYGINYIFTFDSDFSKIGYEKVPEL